MRILHINYSDSKGGAATSVRRLHASFLKNNYDVIIRLSTNGYKKSEWWKQNEEIKK